jgi:hypothetical protein
MTLEQLKAIEEKGIPFQQYTIQIPISKGEKISLVRSIVQQTYFNYITRDKKNLFLRDSKSIGSVMIDVISHMILYEDMEEAIAKMYESNVTTSNRKSIIIYLNRACIYELFFKKEDMDKTKRQRAEYVPTDITNKIRDIVNKIDKGEVTAFTTYTIF